MKSNKIDIREQMNTVIEDLYCELGELLEKGGSKPMRKSTFNLLKSRMLDIAVDELQYFVFKGHTEDIDIYMEHINDITQMQL